METGSPTAGLRERKKFATRRAIVTAALALFEERGYRSASHSRRSRTPQDLPHTVSHYFPQKELILFASDRDRSQRLEQSLRTREPHQTTMDALRAWLGRELPSALAFDPDEQLRRRRIIAGDADLQDAERRYLARSEHVLAEAFAADPNAPAPLHARLTAAALLGMISVVIAEAGAQLEADDEWDATPTIELLDDAVRITEAGLRALVPGVEPRGS